MLLSMPRARIGTIWLSASLADGRGHSRSRSNKIRKKRWETPPVLSKVEGPIALCHRAREPKLRRRLMVEGDLQSRPVSDQGLENAKGEREGIVSWHFTEGATTDDRAPLLPAIARLIHAPQERIEPMSEWNLLSLVRPVC